MDKTKKYIEENLKDLCQEVILWDNSGDILTPKLKKARDILKEEMGPNFYQIGMLLRGLICDCAVKRIADQK